MQRYYETFGDAMELLHLDATIGRQVREAKAASELAERAEQPEVAAGLKLAQDALEDAREALRR
jgi:hypothetical protein